MVEHLISLIISTPWWVFIIFGYLLFVGFKATQPRTVPLVLLFIMPILLNIWSLINFCRNSSTIYPQLFWWLAMFMSGLIIGFFIHNKRTIIINRQAMTVHLPGSWIPLILIMSVFIVKYYFGYACAIAISANDCIAYQLYKSYFSAFASGIFMGNVAHIVNEYYQFKNS